MKGHKAGKSLHASAAIREELCFQGAFIPPQCSESCKVSEGCNSNGNSGSCRVDRPPNPKTLPKALPKAQHQSSTGNRAGRVWQHCSGPQVSHLNHRSPNHPSKQTSKGWQNYRDQFFLCSCKKRNEKVAEKSL